MIKAIDSLAYFIKFKINTFEIFESLFKDRIVKISGTNLQEYLYIFHENYSDISKDDLEQLNDMLYKPFYNIFQDYGFKLEKRNFISHLSFWQLKESE